MKQQFLDLKGLTELVGYLKDSIANKKVILPYASSTLFPSVGDINSVYIDTSTNSIYRWDSANKKYEILAKAVKSVSISESTENGKITLTVDGTKTTVPIHGLKSAAYTESSAYSPAGHTHTKAQVGLGNVDNTADKDKSVKHATTADSATTATNATNATNVSGENATGDTARHVWFSRSDSETKRVYNDNFKYNPATNLLTTNITGSAASASNVPWTGVTGKPSTFTPSAHKHDDSTITSLNASKLFGTIDIARLPQGALERCVIVEDDTARFKLTTANIQLGDTVKVNKTQKMYFVINESKLNSEEGYTVYTAGTATSVPWSGVTGKPSTFTPSAHTHPYLSALSASGRTITYTKGDGTTGTITTQDTWRGIQNNLTSDSTTDSLAAAQGKVLKALVDGKLPLTGGTLTGRLTIKGDAATSPLVVRGIAGSDGQGNIADLYLQYQTNSPIHLGNDGTYTISADGSLYSGTAANAKAVPWTGISGKPSTYPPADHSHAYLPLSGGTMTGSIFISDTNSIYQNQRSTSNYTAAINWRTNSKGWYYDDNGTSKKYAYDPQIGQHNTGGSDGTGSICILPYATNAQPWQQNVGLFIAKNILKLDGNVVLHSANYNSYAPTKTGTGASGTWGISITGNAATATKLATARSINGTNFDGSGNITTATWGTARNVTIGNTKKSVNGGTDVSWSLSEIGAAASSHTHSYLPLSGGTMAGTAMITWSDSGNWSNKNNGVTFPVTRGGLSWNGQSDGIQLYAVETGHDNLELYLKFSDDNSNGLSIRNKDNAQTARIAADGTITASSFVGNLSGTASAAPWSGITGKPTSYPPSSHTHAYLPLAGGTMTGVISSSVATATHLAGNKGTVIINSTAADGYNMLARMKSTNGVWTLGNYTKGFHLYYTADSTISAGTNTVTKDVVLLNESGDSAFPGTVTAAKFSGPLNGNASTATNVAWTGVTGKPDTYPPSSHTHAYLPLAGGTMSGALNFANNTWNIVGDDVAIGDMNVGGTLGVMGKNGNTAIKLVQYGASTTSGSAAPGVSWTCTGANASTISGTLSGTFSGNLSGNASSSSKSTQTKTIEEIQLNKTAIMTYLDTNANIHRGTEQGEMNLYRFFAKDDEANYSKTYGLPAVDNHALVFSIDGGAVYERIIDLDIRSNEIYTRAKINNSWGGWVKLLNSSNYSSYAIPLSGSTVSNPNASNFSLSKAMTGNLLFANTGDTNGVALGIGGVNGGTDGWTVRGYQTANNRGCLEIAVGDDGDEGIYVRQYTSGQYKLPFMNKAGAASGLSYREIVLMEPSTGNSIFPGTVTATTFKGSLSGNASSATALTSSAGSATQPVYFSGGKPVACSYTLGKSVPADAKFTDTNTWRGIQNNLTSTATDQSLAAAQGKVLNEKKMSAVSANGYYGMAKPDGTTSDWIRTTSVGIIPYQSGSRGSGHSGLGTSSWYFANSYVDNAYVNKTTIADKVRLEYDSTNTCLNFVFL